MTNKTGWFNKNKLGNSPKYESYRHSLASKGIKTNAPKGVKGFSSSGVSTPNFDMVKKDKINYINKKDIEKLITKLKSDIHSDIDEELSHLAYCVSTGNALEIKAMLDYYNIPLSNPPTNKKTDMVSGGLKKYYISGYAVSSPYYVFAKNKTEATKKVLKSGIIKKKNLLLYPEKEFKEKWGKYIKFESEF